MQNIWTEREAANLREYLSARLGGAVKVRDLASRAGVSAGHLSRVLAGKSPLTPALAERLARVLGEDPTALLAAAGLCEGREKQQSGGGKKESATGLSLAASTRALLRMLENVNPERYRNFVSNFAAFLVATGRADLLAAEGIRRMLETLDARRYLEAASADTKLAALHALAYTLYPLEYAAANNLELKRLKGWGLVFAQGDATAGLPAPFVEALKDSAAAVDKKE
jgi:transcriptional regulator with XRE-family HTH domain